MGAMGDEAEARFEQLHNRKFVRFGLNRPPLQVHRLPTFVRYTPDYLTTSGFYEVQGCGRDRLLKFKVEKLSALSLWDAMHPVRLWLWDAHGAAWADVSLEDAYRLIGIHGRMDQFREGKPYWALPVDAIDDWTAAA